MSTFRGLSKEEIKQIIISTLKPLGVLRIGLFGSFVRKEMSEKSDIDILVTLPDLRNRNLIGMRWFTLNQELEKSLGIPVDLVSDSSLNPYLREIIQKELEIIYDKAG